MTVRELRTLLYRVTDQDAEVEFVTEYKFGRVQATRTVNFITAHTFDFGEEPGLKQDFEINDGYVLLS